MNCSPQTQMITTDIQEYFLAKSSRFIFIMSLDLVLLFYLISKVGLLSRQVKVKTFFFQQNVCEKFGSSKLLLACENFSSQQLNLWIKMIGHSLKLFLCLSIYSLFVYVSFYSSICPSIHPPINPSFSIHPSSILKFKYRSKWKHKVILF